MEDKIKNKTGMKNAYKIAQELVRDRLREVNPEAYKELQDIGDADVIVVRGEYDFIENVLGLASTPFKLINPEQLNTAKLRPDQILFINCPGRLKPLALRKITEFVRSGGFLFTTDWSLKNVLEISFPGFVRFNQKPTSDEVVRVEVLDTDDPFLKSLLGPDDDPQWWLESSSYPIEIINKESVHVIVKSKEIEGKSGQAPVFIMFDYGEGKVYHMISHFYLQRSETRTARHKASAVNYLDEKKVSLKLKLKYKEMNIEKSNLADVESAYTSSAMMNKILYDKSIQLKKRKKNEQKKD
jgi:hypothetical protein